MHSLLKTEKKYETYNINSKQQKIVQYVNLMYLRLIQTFTFSSDWSDRWKCEKTKVIVYYFHITTICTEYSWSAKLKPEVS